MKNPSEKDFFKEYFSSLIEMKYKHDGQFYIDSLNQVCNDSIAIKINLLLTSCEKYIDNPDKLRDDLIGINGWFFSLFNHHGFVNPNLIEAVDRLILKLGYVGKFKSQMVSSRYADELYLIHDNQLITISI